MSRPKKTDDKLDKRLSTYISEDEETKVFKRKKTLGFNSVANYLRHLVLTDIGVRK